MSFTCPRCNMTSHHPEDERHGYCGNCHEFTGTVVFKDPGVQEWGPEHTVSWAMSRVIDESIAEALMVQTDEGGAPRHPGSADS